MKVPLQLIGDCASDCRSFQVFPSLLLWVATGLEEVGVIASCETGQTKGGSGALVI